MAEGITDETTVWQGFLRTFQETEVIFEEGARGAEMYLVHSGRVRLSIAGSGGEPVTVAILGPGDFFGEMALVDSSQRSATATAAENNTQLLALDKSKFIFMVRQQPQFALSVMHTLCERLRNLDRQVASRGDSA
ncbi:MAG: cyclic nucleotide-binding domain-containing protein [Chloroflexi bacterium]|nr:cyclic nucleotide-binding domain-containing protein [Chloroflexota bacterium]